MYVIKKGEIYYIIIMIFINHGTPRDKITKGRTRTRDNENENAWNQLW